MEESPANRAFVTGGTAEAEEARQAVAVEPEEAAGRGFDFSSVLGLLPDARTALVLVLLAALLVRVGWLGKPNDSLIFDEVYYVNAARVILDLPVAEDAPYFDAERGLDPNREHPPLGKLFIAGSMEVFGDEPLGWRFPSIVAGMLSILLLYGIVRAAGGDAWLGVLAAALLAAENLALVHSRIGTLDMMLTVFMLAGAYFYLRGWPVLAGVACALAALMKLGGVYALLALVLFEAAIVFRAWLATRRIPKISVVRTGKAVASFFVAFFGGLWLLDLWVTTYDTPWQHVKFMLDYGFALTREAGPANQESYPWQWIINDVQMTYLRVDEQIGAGGEVTESRPLVFFRGAMNPIIIGAAPLGVAFAAWRSWKLNDHLALFAVAWVVATHLTFYPPSLISHRISYIFYFLPTVPWIILSLTILLKRSTLPQVVMWGFLLAVAVGFIGYYPIRRF